MRHVPIQAAQKSIDFATLAIVVFAMEVPRIGRSIQLAKAKASPEQAAPRGPFAGQSYPAGTAQVYPFAPPASPTGANPQASEPIPSGLAATSEGLGPAAE